MSKVLILGGTRFFGKKLVERLIRQQADITMITRGNTPDSFGNSVKRLQADRTELAALARAIGDDSYDVVYDNICYTPAEAADAVTLFAGKAGKYIVTSSLSVYPFGEPRKQEGDFDPYSCPIPQPYATQVEYAEGKRLVEAVLFQQASFPVVAVRFPIVMGHEDYTRRLHFHVEHVQSGKTVGMPNPDAMLSFIHADEAARFLAWLAHSRLEGPVNACSRGEISPGQIMALISEATGKPALIASESDESDRSPYGVPESWYMDTSFAESAGFTFDHWKDWLPQLIREMAGEE
ncbi:NAD-dependent epimerase/dehydratase family protein [Paenibacillus mendelii]|uniref:NAD-dependent epimerase/dehydratase family protein n=1 Tax=Paenibacillus mendelii TaxID=206163 RepID=A0ABV6JFY7_9BACL|nr:NAD-dependent epimerase/dehydratase family protein [Paenibacillus mendelii]MCQ6557719.1 NAD-dependent epimerase/dehydratase family protein [Paenibacillus mendelii]